MKSRTGPRSPEYGYAARVTPRRMLAILVPVALLYAAACDRTGGSSARTVEVDTAVVDAGSPRDLATVVTDMMPALERLSGLDRVTPVRVRRQSREGARAYVTERLDEEMPPEEREALRRTYVALGLLPDTLDLDALLLDLYTEQVLGYYDPTERILFVVSGEPVDDLRPVIAHELVHALQDQHADLDSLVAGERGNDRQTAAHAAMEGHAMLVMFALLAEQATGRTVDPAAMPSPAADLGSALDAQNSEFPVFRRAPAIIRETLLFPYVSGVGFVHDLWAARRPLSRYPAPLDSLLPQSTEQVMDARRHFLTRRDDPVEVALPPLPGWRIVREDGLGQLEIAILLQQHLGTAARGAAEDWGGDRYALLEGDPAGDVLLWLTAWDTPAAADRFAAAMQRVARARTDRRISVRRQDVGGRPGVRIIDAPAAAAAAVDSLAG